MAGALLCPEFWNEFALQFGTDAIYVDGFSGLKQDAIGYNRSLSKICREFVEMQSI